MNIEEELESLWLVVWNQHPRLGYFVERPFLDLVELKKDLCSETGGQPFGIILDVCASRKEAREKVIELETRKNTPGDR